MLQLCEEERIRATSRITFQWILWGRWRSVTTISTKIFGFNTMHQETTHQADIVRFLCFSTQHTRACCRCVGGVSGRVLAAKKEHMPARSWVKCIKMFKLQHWATKGLAYLRTTTPLAFLCIRCWLNEFSVLPRASLRFIDQLQPKEMGDAFAGEENDFKPAQMNDCGVARWLVPGYAKL